MEAKEKPLKSGRVAKGKVYYIGNYGSEKESRTVGGSVASWRKMDYVSQTIVELNHEVQILSCAETNSKKERYRETTKKISESVYVTYKKTHGIRSRFGYYVRLLCANLWLFNKLVFTIPSDATVLVYHDLNIMLPILMAKKVKRFRFILEIEEIYSEVYKVNSLRRRMENVFIKKADSYIVVNTEMLKHTEGKNAIVLYGAYKPRIEYSIEPDQQIHIVYAGTLEKKDGSALKAIEMAAYLPEQYHLHILGYGSEDDVALIQDKITSVPNSKCHVSYDGCLSGKEYDDFMSKCQIGLNLRKTDPKYDTAFPSKIMVYFSYGLHVVSSRMKAFANFPMSSYVSFCDCEDSAQVAETVMSIHFFSSEKIIEKMNELHNDFKNQLKCSLGEG